MSCPCDLCLMAAARWQQDREEIVEERRIESDLWDRDPLTVYRPPPSDTTD